MLRNLQNKTIFLYDLFNPKNKIKTWDEIKISYSFNGKSYFSWMTNCQFKNSKNLANKAIKDSSGLVLLDHQLLKNSPYIPRLLLLFRDT